MELGLFVTILSYILWNMSLLFTCGCWKRKVNNMISDGHVGSNVAHNASCCKQCGLLKLVMCR